MGGFSLVTLLACGLGHGSALTVHRTVIHPEPQRSAARNEPDAAAPVLLWESYSQRNSTRKGCCFFGGTTRNRIALFGNISQYLVIFCASSYYI